MGDKKEVQSCMEQPLFDTFGVVPLPYRSLLLAKGAFNASFNW